MGLPPDIPMTRLIAFANKPTQHDLTPAQSTGYRAFVHCPRCRAFKDLDVAAFMLAGVADTPWSKLYGRMRCRACQTPPNFLWVGLDGGGNGPGVKKFSIGTN